MDLAVCKGQSPEMTSDHGSRDICRADHVSCVDITCESPRKFGGQGSSDAPGERVIRTFK